MTQLVRTFNRDFSSEATTPTLATHRKVAKGEMFQPVATKTRLGWIIHGGSDGGEFSGHHDWSAIACCEINNDNLQRAMQEYFSLESIGISKSEHLVLSADDWAQLFCKQ